MSRASRCSAATATRDVAARRQHDDRPAGGGFPLALKWMEFKDLDPFICINVDAPYNL